MVFDFAQNTTIAQSSAIILKAQLLMERLSHKLFVSAEEICPFQITSFYSRTLHNRAFSVDHRLSLPKLLKISILGAALIAILFCLMLVNFQKCVEIYAMHALGRQVAAKTIGLTFRPLTIEAKELHVANAAWGSQPDLFSVDELAAELEPGKLFAGVLVFRHLKIENARLLLERDEQGNGNWKKPGASPASTSPSEEASNSRKNFPVILNATIRNSGIVMITSSKAKLNIDFHDAHIATENMASPVLVEVDGAYHDIPVHLHVQAASYAALRKVHEPFSSTIHAQSASVKADAALEMMDPLNFDQFTGTWTLEAKNLGRATSFFGSNFAWDVPLRLSSGFSREGDDWAFEKASGMLGRNAYTDSKVMLKEGNREKPDALQAELHFEKLDADELISALGNASPATTKGDFLKTDPKPSLLLDALMTARRLTFHSLSATDVRIHPIISEKKMGLQDFSMHIFGGEVRGSAMAENKGESTKLTLSSRLSRINTEQILQAVYPQKYILRGEMSAEMNAVAQSDAPNLLRSLSGSISASMSHGQISRQLIRIASADLRAALHSDPTIIPVSCMAAKADFTHGVSNDTTFRLDTSEGSLLGAGLLDIAQNRMDLFFQTQAKTTSSYALDVPIRLNGTLQKPKIGIASGEGRRRLQKENFATLCHR